ncbi:MAG: tetratricopeptide repeat protein [Treponema sp.]
MGYFKNHLIKLILFIKNLFNSKNKESIEKVDYDATIEEKWSCDSFNNNSLNARFEVEKGDGYQAFFDLNNNFVLELQRKNLYAWCVNKFFRYKDFILEATIQITKSEEITKSKIANINDETMAGSCAVGWIFRNIEKAFYSVLVSDASFFRFDVVINNTPKTLISWTKLQEEISGAFKITIVSLDSYITILINDCWVANIEDDVINASGKIAFAGQNYNQVSHVNLSLKSISINSHLLDVQNKYDEVNNEQSIKKEARRRLANSYYIIGNVSAGINEIKHIEKIGLESEDALLAGKIYFAARLLENAEKYFIKAIEIGDEKTKRDASIQLLNLYYYSDQYKKIKNILDGIQDIESSFDLCNIKAHYLHYMGHHAEAAHFYKKAFVISPEQGLFAFNAGKEYESDGNINDAINSYIEACNAFLKTKQYVDLGQALNALEHLAKDDERYWAISAKFYYAIEKYDEAIRYLLLLTEKDSKDATVWYLYALILQMKKDKKSTLAFEKAYNLSPNESLYCFRYAEALYLEKQDCEKYIEKAIQLDKQNGWAYNLYATFMLEKNEVDKAIFYIEKARMYLPNEITVLGNYIHIKRMKGELKDYYVLFGGSEIDSVKDDELYLAIDPAVEQNRAEAYYLFANELHQADEIEKAHIWYEKALKLIPNNDDLLLDFAINAYMLGYLNEAESYVVKALDISPSLKAYHLISVIAKDMGDYARSEVSLIKAIDEYGKDEELLFALANLYLTINKKEKALSVLEELKSSNITSSNRFIELEKLARE